MNSNTSEPKSRSYTDINLTGRFMQLCPRKIRPYLVLIRFDRPIGWWLLLLPGWWSIVLASGGFSGMNTKSWCLMVAFFFGAIVMRGAGCVVNDLWDREIDAKVERTRNRPLASGAVSPKQAAIFLAILLAIGAGILLSMNALTILLGCLSLPLIALYPFMKRITYWPQLFLGITFNFGALMGWAAVTATLDVAPFLLYAGAIIWTIGYDTIYAHQDKEDDLMAGVKSTALKFGDHAKRWVFWLYMAAFLIMASAILLVNNDIFTIILLTLPAAHLGWQLCYWDRDNQENSLQMFKSNKIFGLLVLAICFLA